ncbi:spore germination protein [Kitasatospora sp. MAA19]|uniref:glycosyl hydrolase family 18 protein n=1 Tax=Kitasatospora sp. MAA19 TaxID=3035090 RepID=UPI0024769976|nr:glycosyl hydrolase family 18 protein [Kitasatospora sp. MAA19]MDH6709627.1 spore germination protein [Kitasatospora sp. MAA19]
MKSALPIPVRGVGVLLTALSLAASPSAASPSAAGTEVGTSVGEGRPARTTSAWLPWWGGDGALDDALQHASQLHTVSPFWYEATSDTTVDGYPGAGDQRIVDQLHGKGIKVVPTVIETPGAEAMAELLGDPVRRTAHADALMAVAASAAYDGLDLDYERMAETDDEQLRERVRVGYDALTGELCARLHAGDKQCVVTVMPRTRDSGQAYDYAHLGRVADRVRIMGYNLHDALGRPGPLSSLAWYEEFLGYATGVVPREKLEVALPAYGWDWTVGSTDRAKHVTSTEAEALRRDRQAAYVFDEASGTPHFTYTDGGRRHEVWYQDAHGSAAHLAAMGKYGVRNSGLWALGFEDPGLWQALAQQ